LNPISHLNTNLSLISTNWFLKIKLYFQMLRKHHLYVLCALLLFLSPLFAHNLPAAEGESKIIIATRGGGSPLLGNSPEATVLAVAAGIEYLELPIMMTGDGELVLFDELTLNSSTDVRALFPEKQREDGGYYLTDFTLAEVRQLRRTAPFDSGPLAISSAVQTLKDELRLIKTLEKHFEKQIGLILDLPFPAFFTSEGKDISASLLEVLGLIGYTKDDKIYIQSVDPDELQRLHSILMGEKGFAFNMIQKIESDHDSTLTQNDMTKPYDYQWLFTNAGLRIVSTYAAAISLPRSRVLDESGELINLQTIETAQKYGLQIFIQHGDDNIRTAGTTEDLSTAFAPYFDTLEIDGILINGYQKALDYLQITTDRQIENNSLPPFFQGLNLTPTKQPGREEPAEKTDQLEDMETADNKK
jgi:glycerophosphoryl diester phosphodiesterase